VKLPVVLSRTEVQALLSAVRSPRYRAIIMVQYASGLRTAEACRLKPQDMDAKRMVLRAREGKGGAQGM
jgi:integrase/recombinase XerD